jgi:GTP-binding protein
LTAGRTRSAVAGYAFTTLNPVIGAVRVSEDGSFVGSPGDRDNVVYDETAIEDRRKRELTESEATTDMLTRNQISFAQDSHNQVEAFRFTIADNPGLVEDVSDNVGLGHSFLRSMERSHALVYVMDLSGAAPWDELRMLQEELEKYKCGMNKQARMVIANKADLLANEGDQEGV